MLRMVEIKKTSLRKCSEDPDLYMENVSSLLLTSQRHSVALATIGHTQEMSRYSIFNVISQTTGCLRLISSLHCGLTAIAVLTATSCFPGAPWLALVMGRQYNQTGTGPANSE